MNKLSSKGLVIPTVLAIAGVIVLLSLGTWQMQRRAWKLGLIDQIETRAKGAPTSIEEVNKALASGPLSETAEKIDYTRVELEGTFDHEKERHLFTVEDGVVGWRIFTPLVTAKRKASDQRTGLFVDRGFVPVKYKEQKTRQDGLARGIVKITGLVRKRSEKPYFAPDNKPEMNEFYWRDLDQMAVSVFGGKLSHSIPYFVEVEKMEPNSGTWPKANIPRLTIPNKHLEYAITWYALALVLIVIYGLFVRAKLKENKSINVEDS